MEIEKKVEQLEKDQKSNREIFKEMMEIFKGFSKAFNVQIDLNKANDKLWALSAKTIKQAIVFLVIIIFRKEIIGLFVWIGKSVLKLSEDWQQTLVVCVLAILLFVAGILIGKKSPRKKSKETNND